VLGIADGDNSPRGVRSKSDPTQDQPTSASARANVDRSSGVHLSSSERSASSPRSTTARISEDEVQLVPAEVLHLVDRGWHLRLRDHPQALPSVPRLRVVTVRDGL
jgi:hypothetical protein